MQHSVFRQLLGAVLIAFAGVRLSDRLGLVGWGRAELALFVVGILLFASAPVADLWKVDARANSRAQDS